jgi:serine/threonine protein kinase
MEITYDNIKYPIQTPTGSSTNSLEGYIKANGGFKAKIARSLFFDAASAIAHVHKNNIVHGDIKASNILLGKGENGLIAKVCDFGWSLEVSGYSKQYNEYGTSLFRAPEFVKNLNSESMQCYSGFEADVWALGLVLYLIIHGNLPPNIEKFATGELDFSKDEYYPGLFDSKILKPRQSIYKLLKGMLMIDPAKRIDMQQVMFYKDSQGYKS